MWVHGVREIWKLHLPVPRNSGEKTLLSDTAAARNMTRNGVHLEMEIKAGTRGREGVKFYKSRE